MKLINFIKINSEQVVAPVSGKCVSITQVNDEVFSSKAMGDGFAIELTDLKGRDKLKGYDVMSLVQYDI